MYAMVTRSKRLGSTNVEKSAQKALTTGEKPFWHTKKSVFNYEI